MRQNPKTWRFKRILIIRFSAIGDVALTTALVRQIKAAFPEAELDFLVRATYAGLLGDNPHLTRIWDYERGNDLRMLRSLRNRPYDGIVDLQASLRSRIYSRLIPARWKVRVRIGRLRRFFLVRFRKGLDRFFPSVPEKYFRPVRNWGITDDGRGLEIFPDEKAASSVRGLLDASGISSDQKLIALAPGAGRATKRWLPEYFAETGAAFCEKGFAVALIGGPGDTDVCREVAEKFTNCFINFCGRTRLEETAELIRRAALLITNDTGVMHIATAVGCPAVALYGPTTRHFGFFPYRARSVVVEQDLDCRPCSFHGTTQCPKKHFRCMREILPGRVVQAAETLLNTDTT